MESRMMPVTLDVRKAVYKTIANGNNAINAEVDRRNLWVVGLSAVIVFSCIMIYYELELQEERRRLEDEIGKQRELKEILAARNRQMMKVIAQTQQMSRLAF